MFEHVYTCLNFAFEHVQPDPRVTFSKIKSPIGIVAARLKCLNRLVAYVAQGAVHTVVFTKTYKNYKPLPEKLNVLNASLDGPCLMVLRCSAGTCEIRMKRRCFTLSVKEGSFMQFLGAWIAGQGNKAIAWKTSSQAMALIQAKLQVATKTDIENQQHSNFMMRMGN